MQAIWRILKDIEDRSNYTFIKGDIADKNFIQKIFAENKFDAVIHLAAESHVDRSITNPMDFIMANVIGTVNLLNAAKTYWDLSSNPSHTERSRSVNLFFHISTDEVYGSLGKEGHFTEKTSYDPRSPYSASKASSDHLARAYGHTYKLPVIISNCSNNYGPNQFPEKLIPLALFNILHNKNVPVYGIGENIRDWLYVEDHAAAIDLIFHKGNRSETYNIGGNNEWKNIDLIHVLCRVMDKKFKPGRRNISKADYFRERPGGT